MEIPEKNEETMIHLHVRGTMRVLSAAVLLSSGSIAVAQPVTVLPGYSVSLLAAGFDWPSGLVYRSGHDDLLVCQQNANKISRIDLSNSAVSHFGAVATPEHIVVDSKGFVYVTTDANNGTVTVFNSSGKAISVFPVEGHPDGLAVDAHNNLYLANNGTKLIVEYTSETGFTNPVTYASGFQSLQGIAFDRAGHLFAEDYAAGTVYYVSPSGNEAWADGIGSVNDSMLDIAYIRNFGLLVSRYSGTVSQIPLKDAVNTFATGFSVATGIAADANGNIYIAEAATGSVWKFSPSTE